MMMAIKMVKFRYVGEPIYDIGLLLEKRTGSDIEINDIVHYGDIITTTDEKCIKIMKTNPNYELVEEEKKKKDKKKKDK